MRSSKPLADRLADLAWRSWTELGVSGWRDQPLEWVVDPEALLLLTASLGPEYPRVWLNALDWSAERTDDLAIDRVRNLHKTWPGLNHWDEFSGVLVANTKDRWPDAGSPIHMDLPHTSRLVLDHPAALVLRLRKALGVNAHTEVLRTFLTYPERTRLTVLEIAEEIAYTKRTAANVVGRMVVSGLLDQRRGTYASSVSLRKRKALAEAFGPLPRGQSSYLFTIRGLWQLVHVLDGARDATPTVRSVEARRALDLAGDDLTRAGLHAPALPAGTDAWAAAQTWTSSQLEGMVDDVSNSSAAV